MKKRISLFSKNGMGAARVPLGTPVGGGKGSWEVEDILRDESLRRTMSEAVERGELPLYLDTSHRSVVAVPLCFVDYSMLETSHGQIFIEVAEESWRGACKVAGMHAALAGVGRGVDWQDIENQYNNWINLPAPSVLST